jgi:hypothetical protein
VENFDSFVQGMLKFQPRKYMEESNRSFSAFSCSSSGTLNYYMICCTVNYLRTSWLYREQQPAKLKHADFKPLLGLAICLIYTDYCFDLPCFSNSSKKAVAELIGKRLRGELSTANISQLTQGLRNSGTYAGLKIDEPGKLCACIEATSEGIAMIEARIPRAIEGTEEVGGEYVYEALYALYETHCNSIAEQAGGRSPAAYAETAFSKGATCAVAYAAVVSSEDMGWICGEGSEDNFRTLLNLGGLMQLLDDMMDLQEDRADGRHTLATEYGQAQLQAESRTASVMADVASGEGGDTKNSNDGYLDWYLSHVFKVAEEVSVGLKACLERKSAQGCDECASNAGRTSSRSTSSTSSTAAAGLAKNIHFGVQQLVLMRAWQVRGQLSLQGQRGEGGVEEIEGHRDGGSEYDELRRLVSEPCPLAPDKLVPALERFQTQSLEAIIGWWAPPAPPSILQATVTAVLAVASWPFCWLVRTCSSSSATSTSTSTASSNRVDIQAQMRQSLFLFGILAHLPPLGALVLALSGFELITCAFLPNGLPSTLCQEWVRSLLFYALAYSYIKLFVGWYQCSFIRAKSHKDGDVVAAVISFFVYSGSRARRSCSGWLSKGQGGESPLIQARQWGWVLPEHQFAAFTDTCSAKVAELGGSGTGGVS